MIQDVKSLGQPLRAVAKMAARSPAIRPPRTFPKRSVGRNKLMRNQAIRSVSITVCSPALRPLELLAQAKLEQLPLPGQVYQHQITAALPYQTYYLIISIVFPAGPNRLLRATRITSLANLPPRAASLPAAAKKSPHLALAVATRITLANLILK